MAKPIIIIDYGAGNLRSVLNAIRWLGYTPELTDDAATVVEAPRAATSIAAKPEVQPRGTEAPGVVETKMAPGGRTSMSTADPKVGVPDEEPPAEGSIGDVRKLEHSEFEVLALFGFDTGADAVAHDRSAHESAKNSDVRDRNDGI